MKDKMLEEGATNAQTGHFYVQNKPQSDNQVKKVEGSAVENSATCSTLPWMSKSPTCLAKSMEVLIFVEHVPSVCSSTQPLWAPTPGS
ncbi:unnamed protein product [Porites lobata]|uniref:Uncharacterized protein n=1 Tax=Porites lobata TaxID=104759 RepID=A0ABN8RP26_9CNID|nr:unnamed protein product [Porites lobata]